MPGRESGSCTVGMMLMAGIPLGGAARGDLIAGLRFGAEDERLATFG